MDGRKPRSDHPVNAKWKAELDRIVSATLPELLEEGFHGEATFVLTVRDGLVQSINRTTTQAHRATAAGVRQAG